MGSPLLPVMPQGGDVGSSGRAGPDVRDVPLRALPIGPDGRGENRQASDSGNAARVSVPRRAGFLAVGDVSLETQDTRQDLESRVRPALGTEEGRGLPVT